MEKHYVYGSGFVGCLYDNGPHCASDLEDAIEGALFIFDDGDMPAEEIEEARENLRTCGIHYFSTERTVVCSWDETRTMSPREIAGADYVNVSEENGPCPEEYDNAD